MITETQLSENKDDQQLIHATDLFIVHLLMKNLQVFGFFSLQSLLLMFVLFKCSRSSAQQSKMAGSKTNMNIATKEIRVQKDQLLNSNFLNVGYNCTGQLS